MLGFLKTFRPIHDLLFQVFGVISEFFIRCLNSGLAILQIPVQLSHLVHLGL